MFKWPFKENTVKEDPVTVEHETAPDGAIEKYWDALFERNNLQEKFESEHRDQVRKDLLCRLIRQTTLCLELHRQAGLS